MIPPLHLITGSDALRRPRFRSELAAIAALGPLAIHLRAPDLDARTLWTTAVEIRGLPDVVLLVNDRVDVALASNAHGVHLGQGSLDAGHARGLLGAAGLIGASVHSVEEARAARVASADFFLVGSMFQTSSHPGHEPEGIELLDQIAAGDSRTRIAIGGISPHHVEVLCSRGAHGIAVRSGVWAEPDPVAATRAYLDAWVKHSGEP